MVSLQYNVRTEMQDEFKSTQRFRDTHSIFTGRNWISGLKIVVFNHFRVYFQQYECLLISSTSFIITFRHIYIIKKKIV